MLLIRAAQMEALAEPRVRQFVERMVEYLRQHHPRLEATLASEGVELAALVGEGVARARRHAMQTERDVANYIELLVGYGPHFDRRETHPAVAEILADEEDAALRLVRAARELELLGIASRLSTPRES